MDYKSELMKFWKEIFAFNAAELRAFRDVDRAQFVPQYLKEAAYADMPLPLLRGKTISQPTTVMLMTHALELEKGDKVFEIGTGSGYQSAIIAKIIGTRGKVISTEVIPELVHFSKGNFKKLGIRNVQVHEQDGSLGMESEAPFDKMIITAAGREFPKPLIEQLRPGGIIIGPVGSKNEQEMVRGIKDEDGHLMLEFLGQFLFTPMYGKYGFEV